MRIFNGFSYIKLICEQIHLKAKEKKLKTHTNVIFKTNDTNFRKTKK